MLAVVGLVVLMVPRGPISGQSEAPSLGYEAALVTFNHEICLRVPPTSDRALLEQGVGGIRPGGEAALFDALYAGTMLASGRGRSLLVLFTDGEDNLSWLDARQVMRVLLESNVLVQVVGIVAREERATYEQELNLRFFDPKYPGTFRERRTPETTHVRRLRQLAEITGGRFWPASGPDRLSDAFLAILEAMRVRYVLRFESDHLERAGHHELEVKLVRLKGQVHSRKAYVVAPSAR
jgi:VWFA-related protein